MYLTWYTVVIPFNTTPFRKLEFCWSCVQKLTVLDRGCSWSEAGRMGIPMIKTSYSHQRSRKHFTTVFGISPILYYLGLLFSGLLLVGMDGHKAYILLCWTVYTGWICWGYDHDETCILSENGNKNIEWYNAIILFESSCYHTYCAHLYGVIFA